MAMKRWTPTTEVSRQEAYLLKRSKKNRRLFAFLHEHRAEIFDAAFQDKLEEMYRETGAGNEALYPARMVP